MLTKLWFWKKDELLRQARIMNCSNSKDYTQLCGGSKLLVGNLEAVENLGKDFRNNLE
jgi:hypothetical protein